MRKAVMVGSVGTLLTSAVTFLAPHVAPQAAAAPSPVDVASTVGVAETTRTFSVDAGDPDATLPAGSIEPAPAGTPWSDPPDDVLVVRHNPQAYPKVPLPRLFISTGTAMTEPFTGWDPADRHDCAWGDYDRDGHVDLFCAVGLDASSVNELWHNNGDGTFTDVTVSQGLGDASTTHGKYRTATFVDANGDGWPDIYVTRSTAAEAGSFPSPSDTYPNELWINRGNNAGFRLNTGLGLTVTASAQKDGDGCTQAFDYDRTGTTDVIMCGAKAFHLYRNSANTSFTDVAPGTKVAGFWADAEWGDFNGDGRADLAQIKGTTVRVVEQTAAGGWRVAWHAGFAGGLNVAVGDANGDGALDLYALGTCTGSPAVDAPDNIFLGATSNVGAAVGTTLSFSSVAIPSLGSAANGCGDAVDAIDYNGDGKTEFLVVNGRKLNAGPTQLWQVTS